MAESSKEHRGVPGAETKPTPESKADPFDFTHPVSKEEQERFDGVDARRAAKDLEAYGRMLPENQVSGMIAIEQRHGLYGYPPSIVMQGLAAKAEGKDMDKELDRLLG